jgi:nucleoside-diphosphate-sugar epimerase
MSQHILITGAGGYIGTTLVPMLLEAGHRITAVDTFWFGRDLLPSHSQLYCVIQDTRSMPETLMRNVDIVIDLAALSNDPCGEAFSEATWEINHTARVRTARLAKRAGVSRYLLASSCSVYGFHNETLDERSPTAPLTVYAKACVETERETRKLSDKNFSVTCFRFATLFGYSPRMRLDLVVNSMCYGAWKHGEITVNGGGTQMRPLLHVSDAAKALIAVVNAEKSQINDEVFNVGSSTQNMSINDIATMICSYYATEGNDDICVHHSGPQDMRSYTVDFSKISEVLDWKAAAEWQDSLSKINDFLGVYAAGDTLRYYTLDWYMQKNNL